MKTIALIIFSTLFFSVVLTSCGSKVVDDIVEDDDKEIAYVHALIFHYISLPTGSIVGGNGKYILTDLAKFENGKIETDFSATIPAEYLYAIHEKESCYHNYTFSDGIVAVSDSNAKYNRVPFLSAHNRAGKQIGTFYLRINNKYSYELVYADRDFTEKGFYKNRDKDVLVDSAIDCSYKKGWNIIYCIGTKRKYTQNPFDEDFEWVYRPTPLSLP